VSPAKLGVIALWVFCIGCFAIDSNRDIFVFGRLVFWATAIAHVAEFAMFLGVFREAGGSLAGHFARTLAFGLFHVREVRAQLSQ